MRGSILGKLTLTLPFIAFLPVFSGHSATLMVPEVFLIAEAVNAATDGDVISLRSVPPTIFPVSENLRPVANNLTIEGRSGNPEDSILQAANSAVILETSGLVNIQFESFTMENGDGIALSVFRCEEVDIHNCVVRDCTSTRTPVCLLTISDVDIRNCTFENNVGNSEDPFLINLPGGAVAILGNDEFDFSINIEESTFRRNSSSDTNGGAIAVYGADIVKDQHKGNFPSAPNLVAVTDCLFIENSAPEGIGGAIHMERPDNGLLFTMSGCYIADGTAQQGGGLAVDRSQGFVNLSIRDSTFENNSATAGSGGGVLIYEVTSEMKGFTEDEQGVAVFIASSTIEANTASRNGGGIAIESGDHRTEYIIEDNLIIRNGSVIGSGIHIGPPTPTDIDLKLNKGFTGPDNFVLQGRITGNRFHLNSVQELGNSFKQMKGSISLSDAVGGGLYLEDSLTDVLGNEFAFNTSFAGGGIALVRDGSTVSDNLIGVPLSEASLIREGGSGGGLITSPVFSGNVALAGGGLLLVSSPDPNKGTGPPFTPPKITNNLFIRNLAILGSPMTAIRMWICGSLIQPLKDHRLIPSTSTVMRKAREQAA